MQQEESRSESRALGERRDSCRLQRLSVILGSPLSMALFQEQLRKREVIDGIASTHCMWAGMLSISDMFQYTYSNIL